MNAHATHTDHDPDCLFCRIIKGEIPSRKVYEDEQVYAFHDIRPAAPVHFLLVPKKHIPSMAQVSQADAPLLGYMMALAPGLAAEQAQDEDVSPLPHSHGEVPSSHEGDGVMTPPSP